METLNTISQQFLLLEQSIKNRRMVETLETIATMHDLVDVLASAFLSEQVQYIHTQILQLSKIDLVVVDMEDALLQARLNPSPLETARILEITQQKLRDMLDPNGKMLFRTNIFLKGKKTFLPLKDQKTLKNMADVLSERYYPYIISYLKSHYNYSVSSEKGFDIRFYGHKVWDNPEKAELPLTARLTSITNLETEGVLWFPVPFGYTPNLAIDDDLSNPDPDMINLLENFTIEADINRLESNMLELAESFETATVNSHSISWKSRSYLVQQGKSSEERIPICGDKLSIGRGKENDIQIMNDVKVSRFHCKITRDTDVYYIEDNSSSNGTIVNGKMIHKKALQSGDRILIGSMRFRFLQET